MTDNWYETLTEKEHLKYEKQNLEQEIKRLREENQKYEAALIEICFCCAAVDCSLEQQSEALKAIDKICAKFYSGQNKEA